MTIQVNSGGVTVNGTITATSSVPSLSASQSLITVAGTGNGAEQDAYTVTAGKTFYLFGMSIGSVGSDFEIRTNAGTQLIVTHSAADSSNAIVSSVPIAKWTAAQVVHVVVTNGKQYTFWGVEQ